MENFEKHQTRQVVIVTGLAGAGKNTTMRYLEDMGFYCVDNLPVALLNHFLSFIFKSQSNLLKVALSVDLRLNKSVEEFIFEIKKLREEQTRFFELKVIFLTASDSILIRRYQETRRKHPLASKKSLFEAIKNDRKILVPIMNMSDITLDTDSLNVHDLRKWIADSFSDVHKQEILVNIVSFGFKYGVPAESNFVCDLRFLPNPYFVEELRSFDGRDEIVSSYIFKHEISQDYWKRLTDFLSYSIKKYYEEGRFFVNVAIGCTGGRHRSVAFVEKLGLEKWENVKFLIYHRDVGKDVKLKPEAYKKGVENEI